MQLFHVFRKRDFCSLCRSPDSGGNSHHIEPQIKQKIEAAGMQNNPPDNHQCYWDAVRSLFCFLDIFLPVFWRKVNWETSFPFSHRKKRWWKRLFEAVFEREGTKVWCVSESEWMKYGAKTLMEPKRSCLIFHLMICVCV